MRRITPDGDEVVQKIYLRSGADDLFPGDDIAEAIDQGINRLLENLSTFESQGSGWTLVAVDRLEVSTAQFNPIGGSSYIPSPERIANTRACVNVQNEDEFVFSTVSPRRFWILTTTHTDPQNIVISLPN